MSIYIKYLIVNALLIFGMIKKKENKVFIIISSVIEALVSGGLILEIAGISLIPTVFCAVIAVMLLWGLTEVMIIRKVLFSQNRVSLYLEKQFRMIIIICKYIFV